MNQEQILLMFINKMEAKMIELMGIEEYNKFATEAAKECFREEINAMEDGHFKDFCLANFDVITRDGGQYDAN